MAYSQLSPALPSPSHPMAKTGYGKRSAGDEDPHADPDFAHLSPRDREIAVFVDHLEEGHAMGYKAIAAAHPVHGQQFTRGCLKRLSNVGHLRQLREHITVEDDSMRWVTRTYWSRTRRSEEWWADFARQRDGRLVPEDYQAGLARPEEPESPASAQETVEEAAPVDEPPAGQPSAAYQVLADLRAADSRMPLSESDCRSLESLAAEWLSRGSTSHDITRALTDGLPSPVTNPGGLARKRLENKMPPKKAKVRQRSALKARVDRVITACLTCDEDERTAEIVGGLCRECRVELDLETPDGQEIPVIPETFLPGQGPSPEETLLWAAAVREAGGLRSRGGQRLWRGV
ncbi:hypothetical protein [Streptomyces sp. B1-3]